MKILLVQPSRTDTVLSKTMNVEPLGLEAIAGNLREHEIRLLDMRFDPNLENALIDFEPNIVGITGVTAEYYIMKDLFTTVKKCDPNIFTVAGGPHATMVPEDFNLSCVDAVCIGEGELTFKQLIQKIEANGRKNIGSVPGIGWHTPSGFTITSRKSPIEDLSTLELPNRELTAQYREGYFRGTWRPLAASYSTRGCQFSCDYCCTWRLAGGRFKTRGVETFLNDLESIQEPYIFLAEDNTIGDPQYSRQVYEAVKERGIKKKYQFYARTDDIVLNKGLIEDWKDMGLSLILVGLEMTTDDELKKLNKQNTTNNNEKATKFLKEIGVEAISYFMVDPAFTEDDFDRLTDYVLRLGLTQPVFFIMTPLPGTTLYHKKKLELTTNDYRQFDFFHCVLNTRLPLNKFYERFIRLYRDTYLSRTASEAQKSAFSESIIGQLINNLELEYFHV